MGSYILRRLLLSIPVILTVACFVFVLLQIAPGDPAEILTGGDATPEDIARLSQAMGLDRPVPLRFAFWIWALAHGDLGISFFTKLPVSEMIGQRIAPTFTLMVMTLILSVLIAIPAGALAAWRHDRWSDHLVMALAVLSFSVPPFAVGYLLSWFFGLQLKWLPVQGYIPFVSGFWLSIKSLILPAVALSFVFVALIARITRATLIETLSQDYIRSARAKGVPNRTILFKHALKNAAIPILTVIGSGVALLVSGAVIIETVFAIPGLGRLTVDAILRRDYPVIQGVVLLFSFLYIAVNLLVDVLYRAFDPRIKY